MLMCCAAFSLARRSSRCADPPRSVTTVGHARARLTSSCCRAPSSRHKPIEDRRAPLVVRIVQSYPHGSAFRYDIVYYGLEPGEFDLKESLRRKDGSPITDLPSIPVKIEPVLPPGQIEPHRLALAPLTVSGGLSFAAPLGRLVLDRPAWPRSCSRAAASAPLRYLRRKSR